MILAKPNKNIPFIFHANYCTPATLMYGCNKHTINLEEAWRNVNYKYRTLREFNADLTSGVRESMEFNLYIFERISSIMILPGLMMSKDSIISIILYNEEEEHYYAVINSYYLLVNPTHKTFINKFIKKYGITAKNIIILDRGGILNRIKLNIGQSLEESLPENQEILSNEFLKSRTEEEVYEVF